MSDCCAQIPEPIISWKYRGDKTLKIEGVRQLSGKGVTRGQPAAQIPLPTATGQGRSFLLQVPFKRGGRRGTPFKGEEWL